MKVLKKSLYIVLCVAFVVVAANAFAADEADPKAQLAKESEAKAKESASTKPTAEMIIKKVDAAAKMLKAEGLDGFAKLQGKDSEYIFAGTYIWVHDMKGVMRMHPIKYKLNGKNILGLKDKTGKLFFGEMNKVAREKGAGWISYMWPKPGQKDASKKVSYVKLCKVGDDELVLGCGVYDLPAEEVEKLVGSK